MEKMKKTSYFLLIILITSIASAADFEGHSWGDNSRSLISEEKRMNRSVVNTYTKTVPPYEQVISFEPRTKAGINFSALMHVAKAKGFFYAYLRAEDEISDDDLKRIITALDSQYKRISKPKTAETLNSKMWWESDRSYIYLIWLPSSSFLSINYATKDYNFDTSKFISDTF